MIRRYRVVLFIAVAWFASIAVANAHEIGTTRVTARFEDGRYAIEIQADAASLVEKLDAIAGVSSTTNVTGPDARALNQTLVARDDVFRRRVAVVFDGEVARPAIHYTVSPASDVMSPPLATIRLTGDVPAGARDFTWSYSWTFASYTLSLNAGAAQPTTQQLEGGQASAPFSVVAVQPPLSRATVASGYLSIFLMILAFRFVSARSRRRRPSAAEHGRAVRLQAGDVHLTVGCERHPGRPHLHVGGVRAG